MKLSTQKISKISALLTLVLILGIIENFFPPIIPLFPTLKLGLSNVIITCSIVIAGLFPTFIIVILKCFVLSLFTGNLSSLMYSLPAGILSLLISFLLLKTGLFSFPAVSAASAGIHNTVQIFVACVVMQSAVPLLYLPYLISLGMLTGVFTGFICFYLLKKLPDKFGGFKSRFNTDEGKAMKGKK